MEFPAPSVGYPLSIHVRRYLSDQNPSLVEPSAEFVSKYGIDFDLIVRISYMPKTTENKIKGPSVSKNDKDIEYVIFLPFSEIIRGPRNAQTALEYLLRGVCSILASLGIDVSRVTEQEASLIRAACVGSA